MIFIVSISLAIHSAFYILIFSRLAFYKEKSTMNPNKKASVVICFHNESENINKYLPSILEQNFDELVLVNDNSTDSTQEILNAYRSDRVNLVTIHNHTNGKKKALSKGIQAAKNDIILLTDADCEPTSINWHSIMCNNETSFVLGYGPMNKVSGFVGLFSRFETYTAALQYLSYALMGLPYMGVGRNLRIDKKIITKHRNEIKGAHLASGDDDLMINALANKKNTSICIHPESFMYSDPKTKLEAFLIQKSRHLSTSAYYRPIHKILLSLFSGSQLLFFSALIFSLVLGTITLKLALQLLLVKWAIQQAINFSVMKKLREDDLFWKFPLLDILFFVYLLLMPIYYLLNKNKSRWS